MAAGLPIITTPVGGIKDIFIDGINGILLKNINADTIKSAIESLLSDDANLAKIKAYNSKIAWEKYEASKLTIDIEDIYEKVINQT